MTRLMSCSVVLAITTGLLLAPASAEVALYLTDGVGDATSVEIHPGDSFDVAVGLGTIEGLTGLSYELRISDNGSGQFSITSRVPSPGSPFPDLITSNDAVVEPSVALLDPMNDRDLGGLTNDVSIAPVPGVYPLATITIASTAGVAPGTYVLDAGLAIGTNVSFEDLPVTTHTYTVVVLAPGTGTSGGDTGGTTGGDTSGGGTDTGGTDTTTDTGTDTSTDGTTSGTDASTDGTGGSAGTSTDGGTNSDDSQEGTSVATPLNCGSGTAGAAAVSALTLLGLMRRRR